MLTTIRPILTTLRRGAGVLALAGLAMAMTPAPAPAQDGLFAPVIRVNGQAITGYEFQQRIRLLEVLGARGDTQALAREQLISDRLRLEAAAAAGLRPSDAEVQDGIAEFAGRADLTAEAFIAELAAAGVSASTIRDFVRPGVAWRQLVQARFTAQSFVEEDEVDRALSAAAGGSSVRVLLSEIIIPTTPANQAQVNTLAEQISELTSFDAFSDAARRFSATPSRTNGGRLTWQPLDALPETLRPIVLGLEPGAVTDPLPIQGAVALFQLRDIEETGYTPPAISAVDYAVYLMPGGRSSETLARAEALAARIDRCDDLYGVAQDQPPEVLERQSLPPDQLPANVATALAALDPGEVSLALTRDDGRTLMFLMLCGRTAALDTDLDRRSFVLGLRNQRLEAAAEGFLAQLRAEARIVEP